MKNPGNFTPLGRKRFAGSELEEPEAMDDGDQSAVRDPRGEWHRGPCSWGHGMRQLAWGRGADNLPPGPSPLQAGPLSKLLGTQWTPST